MRGKATSCLVSNANIMESFNPLMRCLQLTPPSMSEIPQPIEVKRALGRE
jgi:hypothetical protein